LADFGIAKLLTMEAQENYYTSTVVGKKLTLKLVRAAIKIHVHWGLDISTEY
jgi:hypothetical protein